MVLTEKINLVSIFKDKISIIKYKRHLDFRLIWLIAFFMTTVISIIPLIFFALISYNVTQTSIESEAVLRTSRLTSNIWRSISFFLDERKSALDFVINDNPYSSLNDPTRLEEILDNLKKSFGGFSDIGVIDASGLQKNYVGPYELKGKDYSNQDWFKEVLNQGKYISDVFLGFRKTPHIVIAVKHNLPDGSFFVLRAALGIEHFNTILSHIKASAAGDIFITNKNGIIQTPSLYYGNILDKIPIPVPTYNSEPKVINDNFKDDDSHIIGYAFIPETPFVVMVIKPQKEIMKPWRKNRLDLIKYLAASITIVIIWIFGITTFMVRRLKETDIKRLKNLHVAEYSNKMASIGRLAAGVAHEINNPLAIINEKAGLIKDLFSIDEDYAKDRKLIKTVDAVISSVARCGRITKRLLSFARHMDVSIQPINLNDLIHEILGFLGKEAEYRSIDVSVQVPEEIPEFESDRGKLQQIFLNLFNNAFEALSDGGHLTINADIKNNDKRISIRIADDGCGIPPEDLKRVFDPFFSTKAKTGGTGLGLSITYGLIQDIDGTIEVESKPGEGTFFVITLPLKLTKKERDPSCEYY